MTSDAKPKEVIAIAAAMAAVVPHLHYPIAPLAGVKVRWDDQCGEKGILGHCSPVREPDVVCLSTLLQGQWKLAAATMCHELRHIQQRRERGALLFILSSIPVVRRFALEASAWSVERVADELLGFKGMNDDSIPFF